MCSKLSQSATRAIRANSAALPSLNSAIIDSPTRAGKCCYRMILTLAEWSRLLRRRTRLKSATRHHMRSARSSPSNRDCVTSKVNPPSCDLSATVPPGTLRRGKMPSAVWQGFCSLLRDPPLPLTAQSRAHRPYSWESPGGHCASLGLSEASKTTQEGHQSCQDGPTCLQDSKIQLQEGPRWPHDRTRWPQEGSKRPPRRLKKAPRGASGGPEEAKTSCCP